MTDSKDQSFIDTALKHHSRAQTAIKLLQEQLEGLDRIRQSTREDLLKSDERSFEKSATDLLSSASRLIGASPARRDRDLFSSTLHQREELRDDCVIRDLLPSFEGITDTRERLSDEISPIKPSGRDVTRYVFPQANDSLASTALPPTPLCAGFSPLNSNHSLSAYKSMLTSPSKLAPPSGSLNLTEALAKLSFGSIASEGTGVSASSDELFVLLEQISRTSEQLRNELNEAKSRESRLMEELHRLRASKNGYSPPPRHPPVRPTELEEKCLKLEDAMLSLQDENIKLNRMLKSQDADSSKDEDARCKLETALASRDKENRELHERLSDARAQLDFHEKRRHQQSCSTTDSQLSVEDLNSVSHLKIKKSESVSRLEEKIRHLETELHRALTGMGDSKELQGRISELHRTLLEKDSQLQQAEHNLESALTKKAEMEEKCEELQKHDVYKRKEVVQLCDKFEKMKARHKKLEDDLVAIRSKDQAETTRKWAMQDSLHKLFKENESLQNKLLSEQRQLTMSKLLLEKDYELLKKRYDALLQNVGRHDNAPGKPPFRQGNVDPLRPPREPPARQQEGRSMSAMEAGVQHPRGGRTYDESLSSLRSQLVHQRSHTSPVVPSHYRPIRSQSSDCDVIADSGARRRNSPMVTSTPKHTVAARRVNFTPHDVKHGRASPHESKEEASPQKKRLQENVKRHVTPHHTEGEHPKLEDRLHEPKDAPIPSPIKSASLSQLDPRSSKTAYNDEYSKSRKTLDRSQSSSALHKSSPPAPTKVKPPHPRRRLHSSPGSHIRFVSEDGIAYGESPYAREYLSNMDGVRLVANLSHSSDSNENRPVKKPPSPVKSILKSSTSTSGDSSSKLTSSSAPQLSKLQSFSKSEDKSETSKPQLRSSSFPSYNDTKTSTALSAPESRVSGNSLHLSDLPCDETAVYDKFRNFDSRVNGLKAPRDEPKPYRIPIPEKVVPAENPEDKVAQHAPHRIMPRREEDGESVEQSSSSTTRDHAGRIEFLREIQINTGVRMPALMRDVTMREEVQVGDADLAGEVRMGLSDNQEEYANKLVRKYTKNARRILDVV